jgi:hypothetical protein
MLVSGPKCIGGLHPSPSSPRSVQFDCVHPADLLVVSAFRDITGADAARQPDDDDDDDDDETALAPITLATPRHTTGV